MKKVVFLLSTALAYANSNAASRIYISSVAVGNTDLDQGDFEGLTWVEIGGIGSRGEQGKSTNIITYDTWDTTVVQKAKGMTDAGGGDLELARNPSDAGQVILAAASVVGNNDNYGFKEVRADGASGNTGTVIYNRGMVTGPRRPGGRNEDFDLVIFTLAFQQEEVVVSPLSGSAPVMTVAPAITGTAEVGETLTADDGTFTGSGITYEWDWYAGGVKIAGATSSTFVLTSAQLGKVITARVKATNSGGSAYGFSAPTSAVAP